MHPAPIAWGHIFPELSSQTQDPNLHDIPGYPYTISTMTYPPAISVPSATHDSHLIRGTVTVLILLCTQAEVSYRRWTHTDTSTHGRI
ncbi:hypothetical protein GDO81_009033 [Engystomops pustulosus]|uniref:Uncharacterized protein n=1 Tax=Engystomops pustulosus TaxID=76066 RepID=A0AAV7BNE2_ENGPU|nr:hypothetical protein GDO81_009033 [Engystomops pustulosus]